MLKNSNPIIIVAGEPKSVFLELFIKTIKKFKNVPIILIVNKRLLVDQAKLLKTKVKIKTLNDKKKIDYKILNNKYINLINVPLNYKNLDNIGVNDTNIYIKKSFSKVDDLFKKNKKLKLINGPIIKKNLLGKKYLGITEFLGAKYNKLDKVVMLIFNKKISVSPLTTHLPLRNVHKFITKKKIINHVEQISKFYKMKFKKNPKFGITGLNPHCESNYNYSEENRIIKPAVNLLLKKNYKISGPYSADTIFLKNNIKKFDVIIGMYHDQVLTPIKTLFEFNAINVTLGLPFERVSPDHGPNISMFGKNESNPESLIRSIEFLSN